MADAESMLGALEGRLGEETKKAYEERGLKLMFFMVVSGVEIGNAVRPITCMADLKGLKIRAWSAEGPMRLLNTLGANPTTMALNEVYTGLQQGAIDGVITSDFQYVSQKFGEVCKYITDVGFLRNYFHY